MKKFLKKTLAITLAVMLTFSTASLASLSAIDVFSIATASAAEENGYIYTVITVDNIPNATITGHSNPSGNLIIPSTVNGVAVTKIDSYAFSGCQTITSVTIPASVNQIGMGAFNGCTSLMKVDFENRNANQYLEFENFVFDGCTALSSINLENSNAVSMGGCVFKDCTSLTEIVMPDTLVTVAGGTFNGCTSLSDVTLSKNMTALNAFGPQIFGFFYGCTSLKEIVIPASIKSFGQSAFCNSGLATITFAENSRLTSIGYTAFTNSNIKSISIPATVTLIEQSAFSECTNLKTVVFEERNENQYLEFENYVFDGCTALSSINLENSNAVSMGGCVFKDCTCLTEIVMPDTLVTVAGGTFNGCTSLSDVTLSKNMTALNDFGLQIFGFFYGCTSLKEIVIPASIKSFGQSAFCNSGLSTITFAENSSLTSIGYTAFTNSNIKSISIPATVTLIEQSAFSECTNLKTVVFEERNENQYLEFENYVFDGCTALSSINLENSNAVSMGGCVFKDCTSLTEIVMPDTLVTVAGGTFNGCTSLSDVTLSKNMTALNAFGLQIFGFFYGCTSLKEIVIPEKITVIGEEAFSRSGLATVIFEGNSRLTTIDGLAFNNTQLENITIPKTVTNIGSNAFGRTPLKYIVFDGNESMEISSHAFKDCIDLTDVYYSGTETEWNNFTISVNGNDSFINAEKHFNSNGPKEEEKEKTEVLENNEYDVKATFNEDCYSEPVELCINPVTKDRIPGGIYIPDDRIADRVGCFDISIVKKGTDIPATKKADEKVTIRMPIPENFEGVKEFRIVHYFKNGGRENLSTDATDENLKINVDGNYLVFCVTEFSDFDIIALRTRGTAKLPAVSIKNNNGTKTINYGEALRLTANVENMPADAKIFWYVDGVKKGEGTTFEVSPESGSVEVTVKVVDANGNNYADTDISETETITVKSGFFQKLISFFKNLFGLSRIVIQNFAK